MTLHIIDPFKRTTYLRSNESYPSARSHPFCFLLQLTDSNSYSNFLSHVFLCNIHGGRSLRDKGKSESRWLSLQRSVKDVPLWINRLVIGPMVGQTAALRLANRLASPLYYCVVTDTHTHTHTLAQRTHTLSFHADLHT